MAVITRRHRELGFIPDPDPDEWKHLPLLRTSERSSFTRCREQWHRAYVERIGPARKGKALEFGSMIHTALERYYVPGMERGEDPVETFLEAYDQYAEEAGFDFSIMDEDEEWKGARELGVEMLENYLEHWHERDQYWEVIAPELPVMVVVLDKRGRPMCRYLLQLDVLIYDHKVQRYLFVDHKTAASIPDPEEKELDEQCGTYWLFGPEFLRLSGYIDKKDHVSGFIYNILRKSSADKRPKNDKGQALNKPVKNDMLKKLEELGEDRAEFKKKNVPGLADALIARGVDPSKLGAVSKKQPPPLFSRFPVYADEDRRASVLERIRMQFYEMELTRKGKLGVYRVPMFGGIGACTQCAFYSLCTLDENGADIEPLLEMEFQEVDPYEQYRELIDIEEQ